jgi:hypothetical protein
VPISCCCMLYNAATRQERRTINKSCAVGPLIAESPVRLLSVRATLSVRAAQAFENGARCNLYDVHELCCNTCS